MAAWKDLTAQRDELLAAVDAAEEVLGDNLVWISDALDLRVRQGDTETTKRLARLNEVWVHLCRARAAIAKAKGGA